jgi:hypothetical protein
VSLDVSCLQNPHFETSFGIIDEGILTLISHVALWCIMSGITNWDDTIKKEARGLDDYDLGEVQDLNEEFVVTKRGVVDKDKFYLPRSKAVKFDGDKVWFNVTKDEAKALKRD